MWRTIRRWVRAALAVPLLAMYAAGGCTADVIREVATGLDAVANDIDGRDRDIDLGDFLSDLVEDL